ncbi:MAG: hypothetical protein ACE5G0_04135 [Rhodothermales bacterium]
MDWIWTLYKPYVEKQVARLGNMNPSDEELEEAFLKLLSESTVTVLVQEPWQNSVRFKGLARHHVIDRLDLVHDPMTYLVEHYGGGKFKLNFHRGWHFVATQNFKPQGEPKWMKLPEIDY